MPLNSADEMVVCNACKEAIDSDDASYFNIGLEDEFPVCFSCHVDLLPSGGHTQCECCGAYFTTNHMRVNPENGVTEICPYCGGVWCD